MNVTFLQELLSSVAEQGRALLPSSLFGAGGEEDIEELARALISGRGEASGVAIARELLDRYAQLDSDEQAAILPLPRHRAAPRSEAVSPRPRKPISTILPTRRSLRLQKAAESPRLEFFRRLNLAPGATAEIVAMRRDLLRVPAADAGTRRRRRRPGAACSTPGSTAASSCCGASTGTRRPPSWRRSSATRPCTRSRAGTICAAASIPADRRCFAFFHPSLVDEPLVFVEVALMRDMPDAIGEVLDEPQPATAASRRRRRRLLFDLQLPGRARRASPSATSS